MIVAFAIGIAFGFTLERAGLGSARKLAGQFYLTDLTVFRVMFSAIVVAMLGTFWLARLGMIDLAAIYVPETALVPQLAGGLIFGAGFALAGLCPGTSCVAAATGRGDGLAVIVGMFIGVAMTQRPSAPATVSTLPQLTGAPYGVIVFVIVLLALAGFHAAAKLERNAS